MSTLAQQVLARVAASLGGASPASVMAGKRNKWACRIRHATMLALRRRGLSFPKIAQMLGGMDHTTVMHGCEKAALLELKDEAVCAALTAEARLMADEELADRLKRLHRQQAAELRTLGADEVAAAPEDVRCLTELDAKIAELQTDRQHVLEELRKHCKHPLAARRYMSTYSEDEYGSTLPSSDYLFCTDCGQSFNKRPPSR